MSGHTVGYVRVSTVDQNPERQHAAIGEVEHTYEDKVSGKSTDRPELDKLRAYVRAGDTVKVASIDRLARSLPDLRTLVDEFTSKGVRVEFLKENLTFTGEDAPMSNLLLNVLGALAEFERALIRERQAEGIALAKARGVYQGRPPALSPEDVENIRRRHADGVTVARLVKDYGVGKTTMVAAIHGRGVYA